MTADVGPGNNLVLLEITRNSALRMTFLVYDETREGRDVFKGLPLPDFFGVRNSTTATDHQEPHPHPCLPAGRLTLPLKGREF
jgi:hypothetical protein